MILPDVSMWNAGTQHDESTFNAVSYAMAFLLNPPECEVNQTAAQTIATGTSTATAVTFDSVTKDNDGMWDAAHPTYITIQTSGWYEVEWAVSWATKSSDTTIRIQALYLNGSFGISASLAYNEYVNDSVTTPQIWQSFDLYLTNGDTLSLGLMQGTGANLNTASHATTKDLQTFLRVRWASL